MRYKLALSILGADFLRLQEDIESAVVGCDELHLDVCDGSFVPLISFGPAICARIADHFKTWHIDTHLMIDNPDRHIGAYIDGGCHSLIFHVETTAHPLRIASDIVARAVEPGIAVAPITPAEAMRPIYDYFRRILIMMVNPGFGGQTLIPTMMRKVERIRTIVGDDIDIVVDGGINVNTLRDAKNAGANIFVVGSALLNAPRRSEYIEQLRSLL